MDAESIITLLRGKEDDSNSEQTIVPRHSNKQKSCKRLHRKNILDIGTDSQDDLEVLTFNICNSP